MRAVKRLSAVLMVVVFVLQGMATAADFSPKIGSKLSTRKVKRNSAMMIHVEQEAGEEELAHVTLGIPAGFRIPNDAQVEDGDVLGSGQIFIEAGTACSRFCSGPKVRPRLVTSSSRMASSGGLVTCANSCLK